MKKIISVLVLASMLFTLFVPTSFATERVSANYFNETFGEVGSYSGPLATSTTNKVYGNWKLRLDQYAMATSQGTEMTIMPDPDDSKNNVLMMKRTQKYDGYNGIVNLEAIIGLSKTLNTGKIAISFRLKHSGGYTLTIEPFLSELCPEYAQITANPDVKIYPAGRVQQALMSAAGWHTYKFVIDYDKNQTSFYIDEQLIGQPVDVATQIPHLNFVQLRGVGYAKTTYYLDDIKVDELINRDNYAVENIYFTDEDGMFTGGAQAGGELSQAVITKSSSKDGNGTAVFVYYNKKEEIKSVKAVNFTASDFKNNKAVLTVGMDLPNNSADVLNGKTKVFLFNSTEGLKPLTTESEFTYKVSTDPSLYLVGDSTMCEYEDIFYPRYGTGQALPEFVSGIDIYNNAFSGATTLSMLGGGNRWGYDKWVDTITNVKVGDYVILQLGINDCRNAIGLSTYLNNIDTMVTKLREKGANVILASMVTDHIFTNGNYNVVFDNNGKFVSTTKFVNGGEDYLGGLYNYMDEMEGKPGFRSIDMTALTAELIGPDATENGPTRRYFILDCLDNWDVYKDHPLAYESYNNPDGPNTNLTIHAGDTTHLTIYGASKFAQKMAQAIDDLDIALSDYTTNLTKEIVYPYLDQSGAGSDGESTSPILEERGFVPYAPESTGVEVSAMFSGSTVSASSTAEGKAIGNVTDRDSDTYWEAAPPVIPEDKGKSLMLDRNSKTGALSSATYEITPETKLVILEHDFLTTDLTGEKAMPYFYSSTGKIALHTVLEDNTLTARGFTMIPEVEANKWYHIKVVLDVTAQTWKFYVDGSLKKQEAFREDAQNISKIQYHMNTGHAGTFFIDNVKITVGDAANTPIINDDFESYSVGTKTLGNMKIVQGGGTVSVEEYEYTAGHKFPQHVILDFKREGSLEQAEVTFPAGREYKFVTSISRDGTSWSMCSDMTNKFYSGTVNFAFSPTRARYMRISIMESKGDYPASVSDVGAIWEKRNPIENLAFTAEVTTSSDGSLAYDKRGINDNIIAEFSKIGEWRPKGVDAKPWVQYNWTNVQKIDRVVIHGSAQTTDNIIKGTLSFSDGSSIEVTDIPASGNTRIVDFEAKTVAWVRFTLEEFEGTAAVSEIQVYGVGTKPELVEYIEPWKVITLNKDYTSTWFVSADIDDDGEVEMLGCRCDVDQYVTANHPVVNACAFELDGTMIWTWGEAGAGDDDPGGDAGFQIYDIDNDGTLEVLMATDGYLVILNARNGQEEKRYPLPVYESNPTLKATDAIAIANISGNDYPSDIIVKTRYEGVWAYTKDWELIWSFDMPGGMHIGHRVFPVDIDNDGYDEVSIGYSMINPDGSIRYTLDPNEFESPLIYKHSHCDSTKMAEYFVVGDVDVNSVINENDAKLLRKILDGEHEATSVEFRAADTDGDGTLSENDYTLLGQKLRHEIKAFPNRGLKMEDVRICLCFCGGYDAVMIDGNGKRVWAQEDGMHYETIIMAQMIEGSSEKQIVTNPMIPSQEGKCQGTMPIYIFDMDGNLLEARYSFMQIRFPCVINWNGKQDWIYMGPEGLMYDGNMRVRARTLSPIRGSEPVMMWPQARGNTAYNLDLNGDGRQDIVNRTSSGGKNYMYIYLNEKGKVVADGLGSGYNVTFY